MSDGATIITAVFGFLTTCVVSARYMAGYWFRQQKELKSLEKKYFMEVIARLDLSIKDLKDEFSTMKGEMFNFKLELKKINEGYRSNQESAAKVTSALEAYVLQNETRFKEIEKKFDNVGKVTVKN